MSKKDQRFDIIYGSVDYGAYIDLHFCRTWDEEGGCYGTNLDHGFSLDEACEEMVKHHEAEAEMWRNRTHWLLDSFK